MKQDLIALQPVLIQTGKEVAETLVVVNAESEAASITQLAVASEEAAADEKASAAQAIKDDCEGALCLACLVLDGRDYGVKRLWYYCSHEQIWR